MSYKTRRHQMLAFEREVKAGKTTLRMALRNAAMCGAEEERWRTLHILRKLDLPTIADEIMASPVLVVLGYQAATAAESEVT